jgi:hypothetical protein
MRSDPLVEFQRHYVRGLSTSMNEWPDQPTFCLHDTRSRALGVMGRSITERSRGRFGVAEITSGAGLFCSRGFRSPESPAGGRLLFGSTYTID